MSFTRKASKYIDTILIFSCGGEYNKIKQLEQLIQQLS